MYLLFISQILNMYVTHIIINFSKLNENLILSFVNLSILIFSMHDYVFCKELLLIKNFLNKKI